VLEKPEQFEDMMWECARGNISTEDAAKKCGMKLATFYSWLRKDEEAYAVYKKNIRYRKKSVMPTECWRSKNKKDELEMVRHKREVMAEYTKKSQVSLKARLARALGMSYGYYVALVVDGMGRL
jgi:phage antirepressor YoqD-like protein